MVDGKSTAERMRRHRASRRREGMIEVRVWVPSEEAAEEVRKLAEQKRNEAMLAATGLEGGHRFDDTTMKTLVAIATQGSSTHNTPSGPELTLLSELASAGKLEDMSKSFALFARAKPGNAAYVEDKVPAKLLNHFFIGHLKLPAEAVLRWEVANPKWAASLIAVLREPNAFRRTAEAFSCEIRTVAENAKAKP